MRPFLSKAVFSILLLYPLLSIYSYPLGLDPIGPVKTSGSDEQSKSFNSISPYLDYVVNNTNPFQNTSYSQIVTDPSNVLANSSANVRIYFYGNNSDYNNTLGFSPTSSTKDGSLIFPNASTSSSNYNYRDPNSRYPGLAKGDFVDLGTLQQGTPFNLFLAADAADGTNKGIFWTNNDLNSYDFTQAKMVNFTGTNYYLIGWEDAPLNSSDKDFNDLYIVAEIVAIPEPETYLILGLLGAFILFSKRLKSARNFRLF